jgi:hypothetical protein
MKFDEMEIEDKWATIFKNKILRYIRKLVSAYQLQMHFVKVYFPLSVMFGMPNGKPETVNAIVSIKVNAEFDCSQALELFMSNTELLKQAKSDQKYH